MRQLILGLGLFLLCTPALAQSTPKPCERGQSQVKIGGIDMDVTRCQVAILSNQIGSLQTDLAASQAGYALGQADLKAAQDANAAAAEKIAWWAKCVADPVCVTWVNSPSKEK